MKIAADAECKMLSKPAVKFEILSRTIFRSHAYLSFACGVATMCVIPSERQFDTSPQCSVPGFGAIIEVWQQVVMNIDHALRSAPLRPGFSGLLCRGPGIFSAFFCRGRARWG